VQAAKVEAELKLREEASRAAALDERNVALSEQLRAATSEARFVCICQSALPRAVIWIQWPRPAWRTAAASSAWAAAYCKRAVLASIATTSQL
jgi:hypothetical protein